MYVPTRRRLWSPDQLIPRSKNQPTTPHPVRRCHGLSVAGGLANSQQEEDRSNRKRGYAMEGWDLSRRRKPPCHRRQKLGTCCCSRTERNGLFQSVCLGRLVASVWCSWGRRSCRLLRWTIFGRGHLSLLLILFTMAFAKEAHLLRQSQALVHRGKHGSCTLRGLVIHLWVH